MTTKLSLPELIERENDPELRMVLEHYRLAVLQLEAAAQKLGRQSRHRWQAACASRSLDVEWQARRYMGIERAREHKLEDYRDEAPTNPRGYPPFTGLSAPATPALPPPKAHPALPPLPPSRLPIPPLPRPPRVPATATVIVDDEHEVNAHKEAVFDTDRPPSKSWLPTFVPHERHRRIMRTCVDAAILALLMWAIWLLKQHGHRLD
jgi:hypothetical protein